MIYTLLLVVLNALCTFARKFIKMPGFDINAMGIIIISQQGESVILGSILLVLAHAFPNYQSTRYLWLAFPATIITGFATFAIHNVFLLILFYHAVIFIISLLTRTLSYRYAIFFMINFFLNATVARIYLF